MKVIYIGVYNKNEILTGPEKVCKRIFEEYSKIENTQFIHYFQEGNKYGYFKKFFGYEKIDEANGSEVLKLGIFRMLFEIIKLKPRYIHIMSFSRFVVFLYLVKIFMRVKIYYTVNGIIRHENKYYMKESAITVFKNIIAENIIMYTSDRVFYLSKLSETILSLYFSIDKSKLSIAKNGLDDCFLEQKIYNTTKEHNTIVFIGNINQKEKGFDFLLDSLSSLNKRMKIIIFVIDSLCNNICKYSENIEIRVLRKMSPVEMVEFLKDKSIIASPSKYDTFNISVLEAISCGLYPIITKQTGLSEIIERYCVASIIDYGDKISFAKNLSQIVNNKIQPSFYGGLNELSWSNVLQKYYIKYYE